MHAGNEWSGDGRGDGGDHQEKRADLDQFKGKLAGKILLLDEARDYKRTQKPDSHRHDDASLTELHTFDLPNDADEEKRAERLKKYTKRVELTKATNEFFANEGVLATTSISGWDNGMLRVGGGRATRA